MIYEMRNAQERAKEILKERTGVVVDDTYKGDKFSLMVNTTVEIQEISKQTIEDIARKAASLVFEDLKKDKRSLVSDLTVVDCGIEKDTLYLAIVYDTTI